MTHSCVDLLWMEGRTILLNSGPTSSSVTRKKVEGLASKDWMNIKFLQLRDDNISKVILSFYNCVSELRILEVAIDEENLAYDILAKIPESLRLVCDSVITSGSTSSSPILLEASPKNRHDKTITEEGKDCLRKKIYSPKKKKGERLEDALELIPAAGDNVIWELKRGITFFIVKNQSRHLLQQTTKYEDKLKSAIGADYLCSKSRLPLEDLFLSASEQDESVPMQIEYHPLW
ncbi:hypothetical protein PPACK8108_LOCUS15225 [Phakopsora pachyrhizi]|uniref:Uncharacterized protein n=1 Tax=Phakopsora pachyrhizi TaxID=170000 RepID=A0AAV0B9G7_PHAPC|nr:hypothetical protein PPACK8108_LOCUS15225 [Phakopsora pachyrhizi]